MRFLNELRKNNNRDWFNRNKERYLAANKNMISFADAFLNEMCKHDHIETSSGKESLFRIYRDTRFSKDKTPYKAYWAGHFKRATKKLRGGYYFQIGPGETLSAGGFFNPNPADLLRIRKDIDQNFSDWKKLLSNKTLVKTFGKIQGDKVATAPKGFSKDNSAIDLLRHKQFYFERNFADAEVTSKNFLREMNTTFKNLRVYFDYMSDVLTTDANGISTL
ncbi:MAG TPA: DUF2461 domain-containing protein [Chitinophagales bacterium]|nr:DUF2461 domain-containing protein [Chitinophagales bacterium]